MPQCASAIKGDLSQQQVDQAESAMIDQEDNAVCYCLLGIGAIVVIVLVATFFIWQDISNRDYTIPDKPSPSGNMRKKSHSQTSAKKNGSQGTIDTKRSVLDFKYPILAGLVAAVPLLSYFVTGSFIPHWTSRKPKTKGMGRAAEILKEYHKTKLAYVYGGALAALATAAGIYGCTKRTSASPSPGKTPPSPRKVPPSILKKAVELQEAHASQLAADRLRFQEGVEKPSAAHGGVRSSSCSQNTRAVKPPARRLDSYDFDHFIEGKITWSHNPIPMFRFAKQRGSAEIRELLSEALQKMVRVFGRS